MDSKKSNVKPILKWVGGKTQLLADILPKVPNQYGKYVEPFFGGGAVFFALRPEKAVIADSNPELINVYVQVRDNVNAVIEKLKEYKNSEECFYEERKKAWTSLPKEEAAARTIYLNKTCYNGLYRVNKKGEFNTPFGRYKNPKICDEDNLRAASGVLQKATIICGDFRKVLEENTEKGDFVFLDPPYIPVSEYADFKRYTKEQFYTEDHVALAEECHKLYEKGCYCILTNSEHPLVHELYADYEIEIVDTKRSVSSKASSRKGQDAIVTIEPKKEPLNEQVNRYPATRFMGSKRKLITDIWDVASQFQHETVLDLFSGSGIVGYMFKAQGKAVTSNDHMAMSAMFTKAMIENNLETLSEEEVLELLQEPANNDHFVEKTFKGLYFSDEENRLIDRLRCNILEMDNQYKKAIAMTALIRACTKKRPRGVFTYTGDRYNDGRRDLQITLEQQFKEAVAAVNAAVFDNGKENASYNCDAMKLDVVTPDLVYIDPPYYSPLSDNEYVRRYHFVEGLARNWEGVEIQEHTKTKKFKSYPTPFSTKDGAAAAFDNLFEKYSDSILIVSYSSNSLPAKEEMVEIMKRHKTTVEVVPIDYKYAFGNQHDAKTNRNTVQEYLFVGV